MKKVLIGLTITLAIIAVVAINNRPKPEGKIWIGGGPQGGAMIVLAESLSTLLDSKGNDFDFNVIGSGGSVANLRSIEAGKLDLSWGYATDLYLSYQGRLVPGQPRFENTLVLGRVYGSSAQLVVAADSVIQSPYDLINRRIAVGCSGSGSAQSAQRYFGSLGIWDKIIPLYMGYNLGIQEMNKGRAEAVWQLASVPSPSIDELSKDRPIRILNLLGAAKEHDFFIDFPFYTEVEIPAGTYDGMNESVHTYQDNTLLVTRAGIDPGLVKLTMETLFSPEGVRTLRANSIVTRDFDIKKGLVGVQTPLHPQAAMFWAKQGLR